MARFQITVYPATLSFDGTFQVHITRADHAYTFDAAKVSEVEDEAWKHALRMTLRGGDPCVVWVRLVDGRAPIGWKAHRLAKHFIECRRPDSPAPGYATA